MKKYLVSLLLVLATSVALAMPSPKQIEIDLANKDYVSAKSKVAEVLREKPESARAHLLNAFLLIHADKNPVAANEELKNASRLDTKGDVKNSPLFGRVTAEIDLFKQTKVATKPVSHPVQEYVPTPTQYESNESNNTWVYVLLFVAGVGVVLYFIRRNNDPVDNVSAQAPSYSTNVRKSQGREFRDAGHDVPSSNTSYPQLPPRQLYTTSPQYNTPQQPVQQNQPMGMMGTAASVAGGVVAGNLLSDAIRGSGSSRHSNSNDRYQSSEEPARAAPSPVAYEEEVQSFSSGRDDIWSSKGSSSSSSSYSSSDSGSSSWSSDSSSSSDTGSSSDW